MEKAKMLSHFIETHPDFEMQEDVDTGYAHMGALLVDGGPQAGIRYETVVVSLVFCIAAFLVFEGAMALEL